MSEMALQTVTCESCQQVQDVRLYESINVTLEPALRARLLSGELFMFRCRFCGAAAPVAYDTLYHDMERRVMIWLIHGAADPARLGLTPRVEQEYPYVRRLVRSVDELAEKVRLVEAGLDDRVVELFKLEQRRQLPEEWEPATATMLYGMEDTALEGRVLVFVVTPRNGGHRAHSVPKKEYEGFAAGVEVRGADEREWVRVDEGWAREAAQGK